MITSKHLHLVLIFFLSVLFLLSCSKHDTMQVQYSPTPYVINVPLHFPTQLNIPAGNPMTKEGVELGRMLFYDGRLSGRTAPDSLMSCSTCHIQSHSFECGIDNPVFSNGHPHGVTGIPTSHFMLPMINLVWNSQGYLWNGLVGPGNTDPSLRNIEDVALIAITSPQEIDADTNRVKALLQSVPGYPDLFRKAFGSSVITMKNIERAIAQFVRTLVSADSKFDRYLRGSVQLNPQELEGYVLFMTEQGADCFHCHGGDGNPLFTSFLCYNNGKDSVFTDPYDRYGVTGNPQDIGAYKAPTLRNLVFTAPYMHDGRFKTIDEVLDFYNTGLVWSPPISPLMHHIGTGGVQMTPVKKAELKAFLLTLTDSTFVTNPDFGPPAKFPGRK
jgi:cytochrome c peroxidase